MKVIKKHTESVSWHANLGPYSWQNNSFSFTPPDGYTLTKVESEAWWHNDSGSTVYISIFYIGSNSPRLYLAAGRHGWETLTWTSPWGPTEPYGVGNVGAGRTNVGYVNIRSVTWYYEKSSTVSAGSLIKATDWTDLGLSATVGNSITRPSGASGLDSAIIYASEWNSATVTMTF